MKDTQPPSEPDVEGTEAPESPPEDVEGEIVEEDTPETTAIIEHAVSELAPESLASLATDEQIDRAVRLIVKRTRAIKKFKAALLGMTNVRDWYAHVSEGDPEGQPYLAETGAEKVLAAFEIEVDVNEGQREPCDAETGGYEYVYTGQVRALAFSQIWYHVVGSRWSDDGFFTKGGQRTADPGDVRKAAHTNWMNRAIKTACGLKSITWDELERLPGLKDLRNRCVQIGYSGGSGPKPEPGELSEIEKGPHIKVRIPYEDVTSRDTIKKLPKADRLWNGDEKYWVIRYSKKYLGTCADLHAVSAKVSFKPFNVAKEDLP